MRWLALVRNVMVGREGLDRTALLRIARDAGCTQASSHLSTGNLLVEAPPHDVDRVVRGIESGVEQVLGRAELVAVRPVPWLLDLARGDPFAGYEADEWELEVAFLRHDGPTVAPGMLDDPGRTVIVEVRAREVLSARPRTGGGRPHVNRLVERATGARATSRGWSTLQRIAARA